MEAGESIATDQEKCQLEPLGPAPAGSGGGWTSPSFDEWLSQ